MFTHGGRSIKNKLPTAEAFKQHILRAALQASMWNDSLKKQRSTIIQFNGTGKSFMKNISRFGPIYQIQKCLQGAYQMQLQETMQRQCNCCKQELQCAELSACVGQC